MSGYKEVSLSVSAAKAKKLASLKPVNLTAAELAGTEDKIYVHPMNYNVIMKAKKAHKGCRIQLAPGEIIHDLNEREGGSVWSWLKDKAYPWLKKNYDVIKPVLSRVADAAIPAAATYFGQPSLAGPARGALKELTGVGLKLGKGSPEMKARMAKIRSMRKGGAIKGASFRL